MKRFVAVFRIAGAMLAVGALFRLFTLDLGWRVHSWFDANELQTMQAIGDMIGGAGIAISQAIGFFALAIVGTLVALFLRR